MNMIVKSSLVAMLLAGAATIAPTAGMAGVDVTVGIGAPVYAPAPGYVAYDGPMYYDPIYFGGAWYHGPYRWRVVHGERVFWVDGGWHRNEWVGRPIPGYLTFRNGGYYRSGRYDGFEGADRINTRFNAGRDMEHGDRPDMRQDRGDMQNERNEMRDRSSAPQDRGGMREQDSMREGRGHPYPAQNAPRSNDPGPPQN